MVALGADLAAFDTLIGIGVPLLDTVAEEDLCGIPECVDLITAATGETIEPSPEEGTTAALPPTINTCAAWDFFTALVEAAGPELTEESFRQADCDLSPFPITGYPSGTIAPGRAHIPDSDAAIYV